MRNVNAPIQTARNGRGKSGRFAKGNPGGPGRPRGIDFRSVVVARADADGVSIEETLWNVFQSMLRRAKAGDVQAAKLLLDRLCDKDPVELDVKHSMTDVERAARISAILAKAEARRAAAEPTTPCDQLGQQPNLGTRFARS